MVLNKKNVLERLSVLMLIIIGLIQCTEVDKIADIKNIESAFIKVKVNSIDIGTTRIAPYRLNAIKCLKEGKTPSKQRLSTCGETSW